MLKIKQINVKGAVFFYLKLILLEISNLFILNTPSCLNIYN